MAVLAGYSIKGGVGKTATVINLAYLASLDGFRTLVWDLDPQGATSFYLRVEEGVGGHGKKLIRGRRDLDALVRATDFEGLDLLPADFTYRHFDKTLGRIRKPREQIARLLQPLSETYDLIFLDSAPSISVVSESLFVATDFLLVPVIPSPLSMRTLEQLAGHLGKKGPKRLEVLPFYSMVDRRKKMHKEMVESKQNFGWPMLETNIPYASVVEKMGLHRSPVCSYAGSSMAARAYLNLWREVRKRIVG